VSRAGAATLSELTALGVPAVYIPYPVGNGEQRFNAESVLAVGGGVLVEDAAFTPEWVTAQLLPLLADDARIRSMGEAAASVGRTDGDERMADLVQRGLELPARRPRRTRA
jgi:UDP-N-acetylglucosamine--N-acetylmuramyl-(pentapeptide) pyrophosphoryl-undecaprenol N-acetylglucosamine transferase